MLCMASWAQFRRLAGRRLHAAAVYSLPAIALLCALSNRSAADSPRGIEFAGCGDLAQSTGFPSCLVFIADAGGRMVLTNLGSFGDGDRVYVAGEFDPNTAFICDSEITPKLINTVIEPCFSECGIVLENDSGCDRLLGADGEIFALSQPTGLAVGAEAFVTGRIAPSPAVCPTGTLPLIENTGGGPCAGGFGRLLARFGCTVFVDRTGAEFELENYGNFNLGDFVDVQGALDPEDLGPCGRPLIEHNTIRPAFGGPGTVISDIQCGKLFRADLGGLGLIFIVDGLENFAVGERVYVTGVPDEDCNDVPECVIPCLLRGNVSPLYKACGGLISGENGCALFDTFGGAAPRLIEHDGGMPPGSYVFVAGALANDSVVCGPSAHEKIIDNLALPCIQDCGELMLGFECAPLFQADSGGIYWLENLDGFQIGDRVVVTGGLDGGCNPFCPFPCIRANTISYCPGNGDVNLDGIVDQNDVAPFVAVILGTDQNVERRRAADVNGSGSVDAADIQTFTLYVLGF